MSSKIRKMKILLLVFCMTVCLAQAAAAQEIIVLEDEYQEFLEIEEIQEEEWVDVFLPDEEQTILLEEISEDLTEEQAEDLIIQMERPEYLEMGMYGDEVLGMQLKLASLGYLAADCDGWFGSFTEEAVRKFQFYNDLTMTGAADRIMLELLDEGTAERYRPLQIGENGTAVYSLQKQLYAWGYLELNPDGIFGGYTEAAVREFQKDCGIAAPDGQFGPWSFTLLTEKIKDAAVIPEYTELTPGMNGESVIAMQEKLYELGYLTVPADGIYGGYTSRAIQIFQLYQGLAVTGIADPDTLQTLYHAGHRFYTLSQGNTGTAVAGMQRLLAELGYLDSDADGIFGSLTDAAVRAFQKANGLGVVDGIAGYFTMDRFFQDPLSQQAYLDTIAVEYGGTYLITSALGSLSLQVQGGSVASGANVEADGSRQISAQKWVIQNAGDGCYWIRNLKSWKCLDIDDGNIVQREADSSSVTQRWTISKNEAGGYHLINGNGLYLSLYESEDAANAIAVLTAEDAAQAWYFQETDAGTALDFTVDGTQYIGIRSFNVYQGNVTETSGYYPIQTSINLPSGGYYLSGGDNYSIGLKVMYVNSFLAQTGYLSWNYYNYNRYDGNTVWAVRQFQADHGLPADGIVGLYTWRAMGYSDYDFYNLGAYTTDLKVYAYGSDRAAYVQAMLNTAAEYAAAGTGFKDGASGQPGTYVDCSGLIYQCLYAAGINPDTNIIDHARVVYEYTSAYLGSDWKLGASVSNAQPGDLIFYGGNSINHVAIYAGGGMIYDSWPGLGVTYRGMYSGGTIVKIVRIF